MPRDMAMFCSSVNLIWDVAFSALWYVIGGVRFEGIRPIAPGRAAGCCFLDPRDFLDPAMVYIDK